MRYYKAIFVNLEENLIKLANTAVPMTKKEAITYFKNLEQKGYGKLITLTESKEFQNERVLEKFNFRNLTRRKHE